MNLCRHRGRLPAADSDVKGRIYQKNADCKRAIDPMRTPSPDGQFSSKKPFCRGSGGRASLSPASLSSPRPGQTPEKLRHVGPSGQGNNALPVRAHQAVGPPSRQSLRRLDAIDLPRMPPADESPPEISRPRLSRDGIKRQRRGRARHQKKGVFGKTKPLSPSMRIRKRLAFLLFPPLRRREGAATMPA